MAKQQDISSISAFYFSNQSNWFISAEELRQYFYCPRIPFFRYVRKIHPKTTYLMQRGTRFHDESIRISPQLRIKLPGYSSSDPKSLTISRYWNYYLESTQLHLLALLDLFEYNNQTQEFYPVEIKTGPKPAENRDYHHRIQLTAQALLLEEKFHTGITRACIYYIDPSKIAHLNERKLSSARNWIPITIDMKQAVLRAIRTIHQSITEEIIPSPCQQPTKCQGCEYWFICQRS